MRQPDTLVAALERAATSSRGIRFLDRAEQERFLPYAEILVRARRVAGGLFDAGVRTGDRVALVLPTSPAFLDAFFGTLLAGAVPVPLYPPVRLGRLEEYHERTAAMLTAAGARLLLSDRRIKRLLGEATVRARVPLGCRAIEGLVSAAEVSATVGPDDLAFVQFSSGTTTAPKPVALTHRQVLNNVRAILTAILSAHPESDVTHAGVSWLPLYHDMGLIGCVLVAVDHPGDLTLIPPELFIARPAIWLRAISKYGGTISPAPNFAYALCTERIADDELEGVDLFGWRVALNGAEPVTPLVLRRFVERFQPYGLRAEALTPVYGLAEAALAVTFSPLGSPFEAEAFAREALAEHGVAEPDKHGVELVNLGTPLPGFELRILSDAGAELPPGQVGRVWVRGPSLMQGYLDQPEATAAALHDGWLDTGDTGFLHRGDLFLYGRAKDLIVVRGRNWAPQDIEQVIDEVDGVRTGCSAAVGVVEEDGELLVTLVEQRPGADETLAERIRRRVLERTGLTPRVVLLEPGTLPRTSSGKIRRSEARRAHLLDTLRPPAPVTALSIVRAMVRSSWKLWSMRRAG